MTGNILLLVVLLCFARGQEPDGTTASPPTTGQISSLLAPPAFDGVSTAVAERVERAYRRLQPALGKRCFSFNGLANCTWMPGPSQLHCCCDASETSASCLPTFSIMGAQKSGSTALYTYFLFHPNFRPSAHKESHFFDRFPLSAMRANANRSYWDDYHVRTYTSQASPLDKTLTASYITGDASPSYISVHD
jgi:hypothetical protein